MPGQNLVNPLKADDFEHHSRPHGFWWLIALRMLGVLAALGFGYAYFRHLALGFSLWFSVVALLFFVAFSILQVFLEKSALVRVGMLMLEAAALFAPFVLLLFWPAFGPSSLVASWQFLWLAFVLTFIFLVWGYGRSRSELTHGTQIRFFKMTHPAVGKIVTVALFFMIAWYAIAQGSGGNFFVSEANFNGLFTFSSAFFNGFYPTISVDGSFHDFAVSVASEQVKNVPMFYSLTPAGQADAISQDADAFTQNFSKDLGVVITPTSTVSGVVYSFITQSLHGWQDRFGVWFVVAWGLGVFVILRSVAIVFIWIAQFFGMLFYELTLAVGLVQIVEQPQTREVVEFR